MADINNTATNTAGEAGQNTNTFDAYAFVDTVLSAVEKKNAKNKTSIINSNFDKLSDERKELAFAALNEKEERAARKEKEAFEKMQKERDDAIAKLASYEKAEQTKQVNAQLKTILSDMDVTDEKNIGYALKMLGDQSDCFKEGKIDTEILKTNVSTLVNDMPFLKSKKEIQKGATTKSDKELNDEAQMEKWLKAIGLSK